MNNKIEEWREIIVDCKSSGLPQREYCRGKNLSYATFSYWRAKINKIDSPACDKVPFVRRSLPSLTSTTYVLEWPDGMKLRMPIHLRAEEVTNLVNGLRAACR